MEESKKSKLNGGGDSISSSWTFRDYCTRLHGAPFVLDDGNHNIVNLLFARERTGSLPRRQLITPNFHKNIKLQKVFEDTSCSEKVLIDISGNCLVATSGTCDGIFQLRSAIDGRLLTTFPISKDGISAMDINLEITLLATASWGGKITVWDLQSGSVVTFLGTYGEPIISVNFVSYPNMKCLVTTGFSGSISVYSYSQLSGQVAMFQPNPTKFNEPEHAGIICASFSPGGMFLATGSYDQCIRAYQICENGPIKILEKYLSHSDLITLIQWAHSGLRFISGSDDGTALIWKFENKQWKSQELDATDELASCPQNEEDIIGNLEIRQVCWNLSDDYVMTAVSDHTIKVWNSETGRLHKCLHGHSECITVLKAHPKDAHVLLSACNGQIYLWDIYKGVNLVNLLNQTDCLQNVRFFDADWLADGSKIVAVGSNCPLIMFGFGSGHPQSNDTQISHVTYEKSNHRDVGKPIVKPLSSLKLHKLKNEFENAAKEELDEYHKQMQ